MLFINNIIIIIVIIIIITKTREIVTYYSRVKISKYVIGTIFKEQLIVNQTSLCFVS